MEEATNTHEASALAKDIGKRGDVILPAFPFLYDDADDDEEDGIDKDDDYEGTEETLGPDFALTKPSLPPSPSAPRTMKITMPFMRAYKAMRGPRDVEPSPLFARLRGHTGENEEGHDNDLLWHTPDPFVLADCDEVRFLNQVNDALYAEEPSDIGDDDARAYVYRRRLQALSEDDDNIESGTNADTGGRRRRQTVFFFEAPAAPPPIPNGQQNQEGVFDSTSSCSSCTSCSSCRSCGSCNSCSSCSSCIACCECGVVADHVLDGACLDAGWLASGADAYVSDDDGPSADTRLTPATFRALAAGCSRDEPDTLQPQPGSSPARFRRPRTPPNTKKIVADWHADNDNRLDNVRPHRHRRQFDLYTGEELSPLYRVERGSIDGPLTWSPPGLTPERAGFLLRERKPWLSDGGGGGSDWSQLYKRIAPEAYQALRVRLYGDVLEETSSSSSSRGGAQAEKGRDAKEGEDERTTAAETLLALHNGWEAVETAQVEDARLEAAQTQAEAILTAQARCLTRLELVQATVKRKGISSGSGSGSSSDRYQDPEGSSSERLPESLPQRTQKSSRHRQRMAPAARRQTPELQIRMREAEARVAQGWERQRVLAQRVQQGMARLERAASTARGKTAARLLDELDTELAQLEISGRM